MPLWLRVVVPELSSRGRLIAKLCLIFECGSYNIEMPLESLCHNGAHKLSLAIGPRGAGEAFDRGCV